MELAIINGTYRNGTSQNQLVAALAAAAATNSTAAAAAALRGSPSLATAASRIIGSRRDFDRRHVVTFVHFRSAHNAAATAAATRRRCLAASK